MTPVKHVQACKCVCVYLCLLLVLNVVNLCLGNPLESPLCIAKSLGLDKICVFLLALLLSLQSHLQSLNLGRREDGAGARQSLSAKGGAKIKAIPITHASLTPSGEGIFTQQYPPPPAAAAAEARSVGCLHRGMAHTF